MKKERVFRKLIALFLCVIILSCTMTAMAVTEDRGELSVAVVSDIHVYPDSMTGGRCEAYLNKQGSNGRAIESTQGLFADVLADLKIRAENENIDFLLLPGDMTEWGEYEGHLVVADMLKQFELETGIDVAVIPGNHDINNKSVDFSSGEEQPARPFTPVEFWDIYADFGYDLPGLEVFDGTLSYSADLGDNYRLIAMDTERWNAKADGSGRITKSELRDWVLAQCAKAKAEGKTIISMGHHNLGEQIGGQDALMSNTGFENISETAEAFADAGLHFYFSGHLHFNEISMRVSDNGEPLYDIITAASAFFPGGYRTVKFAAEDGKIEADVQSHSVALTNPAPYPDFYYQGFFGRSFGGVDGSGITGWLKHAIRYSIAPQLADLSLEDMVKQSGFDFAPLNILLRQLDRRLFEDPDRLLGLLYNLVDEAAALEISEVPCTRFIGEYGFGELDKPGTLEDFINSLMLYMFAKRYDVADDPFMTDVLNQIESGEFIERVLDFALPKIIDTLGDDFIPMLVNNPIAFNALSEFMTNFDMPHKFVLAPLVVIAAGPDMLETMSKSLYGVALGIVSSQSPTGSPDGVLVYDGPIDVPTDANTYRLPQDIDVVINNNNVQISWYTRRSAQNPVLTLSDKDGNLISDVNIVIDSKEENIMAGQVDLGLTKIMGYSKPVLKHTATLTGLKQGGVYHFTAGDSVWEWYSDTQQLNLTKENSIFSFFRLILDWLGRIFSILGLDWT